MIIIYMYYIHTDSSRTLENIQYVTNLGVDMARFTQFPPMITQWAIIYEIISPGAAGSNIYV